MIKGIKGLVGPGDEEQITQAITGFAEAVDAADTPKTLSYLCAEEARQITDDEDYDPNDTDTIDPIKRLPVNISDIQITEDTATAQVTRPPNAPRNFKLKQEAGTWSCATPAQPESFVDCAICGDKSRVRAHTTHTLGDGKKNL